MFITYACVRAFSVIDDSNLWNGVCKNVGFVWSHTAGPAAALKNCDAAIKIIANRFFGNQVVTGLMSPEIKTSPAANKTTSKKFNYNQDRTYNTVNERSTYSFS